MYHSQFAFAVIEVFKRYVLLHEKIIKQFWHALEVCVNTNIFTTRKE